MSDRSWLWLPLFALTFLAGTASALPQPGIRLIPNRKGPLPDNRFYLPPPRPSHLPLEPLGEEPPPGDPDALLAERLQHSHGLQQMARRLMDDKQVRKLAENLLKDPKLRESIEKQFTPEELKNLQEALRGGKGMDANPLLRKFLDEKLIEGDSGIELSDRDRDLLRRWLENNPKTNIGSGGGGPSGKPLEMGNPATRPPEDAPPPRRTQPEVKDPNTLMGNRPSPPPEWVRNNMDRLLRSLDRWVDTPTGEKWSDFLGDLARRYNSDPALNPHLLDRARDLAQKAPSLSRWVPQGATDFFRGARAPNLPRMDVRPPTLPSTPAAPSVSVDGRGAAAVVWVVALVVVALLLARVSWRVVRDRVFPAAGWKLGPWPVRPEAVSTRADLVRAFEHLALLCLGPAARSRNHLDLAGQLGAQPADDSARRQEAADELARLYEVARYAPDDTPLAPDDLAVARCNLCYLAGVSAA